ncbi:MAG: glycosyltransferase family 2 protein [Sorangiineae bacterium]|nr:glycosyltransferase family 2 protein [Polyangiaceae bacterium]MEB2321291.1 glycosyltransferase family 2 protein [Sorangiineae bacterium]
MWRGLSVAVVVPAYREERLLGRTLGRLPDFVDHVVVVDDASPDGTLAVARSCRDTRVRVLRHEQNHGVGAAIVTGYRSALEARAELIAVMAGDDQMHPDDLAALLEPVASGRADYAKGNRFLHPDRRVMPLERRAGGMLLSALTRVATGLTIDDSQCGFTVAHAEALRAVPLEELWPRFGYPNDLLGMLAARGLRAVDVPVRPVYADERSGIRPWHFATVAGVVARRWWLERQRARSGMGGAGPARRPLGLADATDARATAQALDL